MAKRKVTGYRFETFKQGDIVPPDAVYIKSENIIESIEVHGLHDNAHRLIKKTSYILVHLCKIPIYDKMVKNERLTLKNNEIDLGDRTKNNG